MVNVVGDTTWCKGAVTRKYVKDGYALIDIQIHTENQRKEVTANGLATVSLPSRNVANHIANDGAGLSLDLPSIR